ncbi:response regulator transcription factor [Iodidimonas sp. SYSU 1G8]|uniref:response regulator transcription factor n=1 Tax=Iodidimonas sp. SYSU 1G8 TaxID=3133967 RepID=UPI0031FEF6D4
MGDRTAIALIEDDPALAKAMAQYLSFSGFEVAIGASCEEARLIARTQPIALFILDRILPDGDGLSLAGFLRTISDAAIIILSGRGEVNARIEGLNTGADDYLVKPAAPEELLARVNAVIRRSRSARPVEANNGSIWRVNNFTLDAVNNQLTGDAGASAALTEIETLILSRLIQSQNDVVDKNSLSMFALGRAWQPEDRSIDVHLARLRRKFRDVGLNDNVIHTVRGKGYRFVTSSLT